MRCIGWWSTALLLLSGATHAGDADEFTVREILPSEADPGISRFDDANYVVSGAHGGAQQELVVFLPGTGGAARHDGVLLRTVAQQGYRVIGLTYNDKPAIVALCPDAPPACSAAVRERRIFGTHTTSLIDDKENECVAQRLTKLLQYLKAHEPEGGWSDFLVQGEPNWSRIVVSGLSQGAGMAAFIAKQREVARVVLFSSPWDYTGRRFKTLAPWLSGPSLTPPERWFGEFHRREETAALIAQAFTLLKIPPNHVLMFNLGLPANMKPNQANPYHMSTVRNTDYADAWRRLYGLSP
jgi:hypothetical protein